MPPGHRPSYLCIEDPLVPGNDVGKSSYGALQVKQAFDWAYGQLQRAVRTSNTGHSGHGSTLLSRIVQVDQETIDYRNWIRDNHPLDEECKSQLMIDVSPFYTNIILSDYYERSRLTGMVAVRDNRLVPVVSALDHGDHGDADSYQSDASEPASSDSCRSDSPDTQVSGPELTHGDTGHDNDSLLSPEPVEAEDGEESVGQQTATPSSAMSISPANSEVGTTRVSLTRTSSTGSSSQASSTTSLPRNTPYRPPKAHHHTWGKNKKGLPDRADLDTNWRSGSGTSSEKSSNSGNEREVVTKTRQTDNANNVSSAVSGKSSSNESRADMDTNWREHHIANLPPTGAKGKGKVKNQKSNDKGSSKSFISKPNPNCLPFSDNSIQSEPSKPSKNRSKQESRTPDKETKPIMNGKLDIFKLRSVVEKNILDNDRLQQKAEARKSSDSRLEIDNNKLEKSKSSDTIDNIKHHEDCKNDNYQLVDSENGPGRRKKKKKKKSERPDCVPSQKAAVLDNSDEFDAKNANSKLDVRNRFSRELGPRLPKR